MVAGQPKVPQLRFPDFAGELEEKRLGEFFSFKNGVNADKPMYGRGRKFINVMDIVDGRPISSDQIIGSVEISAAEFEKNEVICGDILFQRSSETREEVGQSSIYIDAVRSATFGGFVIRGRPIVETISTYFHWMLKTQRVRKDMTSRSGGSTRYNIGQDSLSDVSIHPAPSLLEQKKIAAFLGAVDEKLSALRKKRDLLAAYKRGAMQQIFSQKLRFARDDGSAFPDWDEKRLGEVFDWVRTNNLSREFLTYEGGNVQNIHYGDIHTKFKANFRQSKEKVPFIATNAAVGELSDEDFCRFGDIVIADASEDYADIGKAIEIVEVRERTLVAGLHTYIARPRRSQTRVGFCGYLLRSASLRRQIMRIAQGISVLGISKSNLEKLMFLLPHPDEQTKIADFLSALDAKIDAVAAQITQMESFKKGLLQQMFV